MGGHPAPDSTGGTVRVAPFLLLAALACDDDEPASKSVLETTATSYVAADDPDSRFDYSATIIVKLRNTSDLIVRLSACSASIDNPPYFVEKAGTGLAAWDPVVTCATFGTPSTDLSPGAEWTDTLLLRAPWNRTITGGPIGDIEGTFYLVLETEVCGLITPNGTCSPGNRREYVRSNHFTITK